MKSKRSRACDISKTVKEIVWNRDKGRCVLCGSRYAMPNAHYIPRSKGGLGIEQNVVTLCLPCHERYDHTTDRRQIQAYLAGYLESKYADWNETNLIYNKWG